MFLMRFALGVLATVAAATAAPLLAAPVGFALFDIEGADADRLAQLGHDASAAFVATVAADKPAAIVANTVLDATPEEKESRFVTPPPEGIIPKQGVPASVYIVRQQSDGLGVYGELEYRDYSRKTLSTPAPAGPGYREDRKSFRAQLGQDRATMFVYGTLTRNRVHGSRFLVAVFQPNGPVKVEDLSKADAVLGRGAVR